MSLTNNALIKRDLQCLWHPCSQMHDSEKYPPIPISHGKGIYLYDFDGNKYIDCISSWWVNLFGHSNPSINAAITAQLGQLEHTLLAGFTHKPIIELSENLINATPAGLDYCFYADNGSSSVEIALKMSFHAELLRNDSKKPLFVSLEDSYHGETLGALGVGDVGLYKDIYAPLMLHNLSIPTPLDSSPKAREAAIEAAKCVFSEHKGKICALIIEPLVQCAGGMKMHSPAFVRELCSLARAENIAVIFDEIAVGFGRTGSFFAFEQCDFIPDYLCLSKGITGGYLPLSAVLMSHEIYQLFYAPYHTNKAFLHSHSYTGNALAAAAANAVFRIFKDEDIIAKNREKSARIAKNLESLSEFRIVKNQRIQGMIAAFDLDATFLDVVASENEPSLQPPHRRCEQQHEVRRSNPEPSLRAEALAVARQSRKNIAAQLQPFTNKAQPTTKRIGMRFYELALKRGLLLRPLGNVIYLMPPYIITNEEIDFIFRGIKEVLTEMEMEK